MRPGLVLAAVVAAGWLGLAPALAAPRVAVDLAPLHAIVARIMQDAGTTPGLVLPPGASPHGHGLRPSEAALLEESDVVFWIGPALTPWFGDTLAALAAGAVTVEIAAVRGLTLLPVRDEDAFEAHHAAGHDRDGRDRGAIDPHLWLDPVNGAAIARAVAAALAEADPANAALYLANAAAFVTEMQALTAELEALLAPLRGRPFVVFHDAFRYFEARFELPAAGTIALSDAAPPGAARVAAIRDRIREAGVACVFAEPQFEPRLIATVTEGTDARTGTLDPLGAGLEPGPGLYPELLRGLAAGFADCLGS
jgi:zinc transport system substrate-binding protein